MKKSTYGRAIRRANTKCWIANFSTTTDTLRHRDTLLASVLLHQFSLHQLFRQLFCQLSQLSPRQLRPPQCVRQPDERVLKVDEEGRVRRLLTCSYASCFWKHREGEASNWDSELEVDYLSLVCSQYIDLSSPLHNTISSSSIHISAPTKSVLSSV